MAAGAAAAAAAAACDPFGPISSPTWRIANKLKDDTLNDIDNQLKGYCGRWS